MILAGIDEAGLGPTLGPLVTAAAALSVPDGWRPDSPWRMLADVAAEKHSRSETRCIVCDSKPLYRSGGMAALEIALGAFSLLACGCPRFAAYPVEAESRHSVHQCYSRAIAPFPAFVETEAIDRTAERLGAALLREHCAAAHLRAAVLFEPILNRRFDIGLNKNQALLMETGAHLARLVDAFPDQAMLIVVDKQGGRNEYLPFLSALFPGAWLDTLSAGAEESRYRLRRKGGDVEIRFAAKADRFSFPTALASMAAKYTRERAMAELNAWFAERVDGLLPTAGYPRDARRWLQAVEKAGKSGEFGVERLIRQR